MQAALDPVPTLPDLESLEITPKPELLKETVVLKLNGGLGAWVALRIVSSF